MKNPFNLSYWFLLAAVAGLFSSCAENSTSESEKASAEDIVETKAAPPKPQNPKPKAKSKDSIGSADQPKEARPERPEGSRGGGGKKGDWRNMSPEERNERRRQMFAEIDKNGDGNLGKDEVPERMWEFMSRADKNGDDMITEEERIEYRAERETERMMRELSGEAPEGFDGRRGRGPGGGFGPPGDGVGPPGGGEKGKGSAPEAQQ